jgi:hypothetical protein
MAATDVRHRIDFVEGRAVGLHRLHCDRQVSRRIAGDRIEQVETKLKIIEKSGRLIQAMANLFEPISFLLGLRLSHGEQVSPQLKKPRRE